MARKKTQDKKTIYGIAGLVFLIAITIFGWTMWSNSDPKETKEVVTELPSLDRKMDDRGPNKPTSRPMLSTFLNSEPKELKEAQPGTQFGQFKVMKYQQNLNDNNQLYTVALRPSESTVTLAPSLIKNGFTHHIDELIVYQIVNKKHKVVLSVTKNHINDEKAKPIINSKEAEFGYALSISTHKEPKIHKQPVTIFSVVQVNAKGEPASDEITVYWQPKAGSYKASNTFGAPGTY